MKKKTVKNDENQSVVYKVPAAVALLILVITWFRNFGIRYAQYDNIIPYTGALFLAFVGCAILCAAALVCALVLKKKLLKTVCWYLFAGFALLTFSFALLTFWWVKLLKQIYLMHALVYCLYMVWQLYRGEFFAFSLSTATAGAVFYLLSQGFGANARSIITIAVLVLAQLAVLFITYRASRCGGMLKLGRVSVSMFPSGFNPLLLYFSCALWLAALVGCLIFGARFAHYCIFAAVGIELMGAVYYTFQLK